MINGRKCRWPEWKPHVKYGFINRAERNRSGLLLDSMETVFVLC